MSEQALDISFRRKANISDLARDAGVSTATVDRVLNRRGGVRLPTVHRVLNAADRLGYELPPGLLAGYQPRPMRLAFVLPQGANRYLQMMAETTIGWLLLEQAVIALGKLDTAPAHDKAFYAGKRWAAQYFAQHNLPNVVGLARIIGAEDTSALEIPEEAIGTQG